MLVLVVAVAGIALVVASLLLRPDAPAPQTGVDQNRSGPVLLVPGYGGDTALLSSLADALRAKGRTAVVLTAVGDGTGDLREQAAELQRVAAAQVAGGAPSVDVVGYSAGGVTARLWVADGGSSLARRVVTLGAPHHGTTVASLAAAFAPDACPTACQQLVPGTDLLETLPETPAGPVWTSIWSAQDQVVTPPDSARLQGAVNIELQQVCTGVQVSHDQLPADPLVLALVDRALAVAPLDAVPPPSDCALLQRKG